MESEPTVRRRALLAGTAGVLTAASGCIGEIRNLAGRQRTRQLSLDIATMPAAEDPYAVRIANRLRDNLQHAGINATVDLLTPEELFRSVLINHDFDIYVARFPGESDPDELRSLLFSGYREEAGWQNPFGFSDITMDELLDDQRTATPDTRTEVVTDIVERVVREQPFTVVAFPDHIAGVRTDRFDGWQSGGPVDPMDYLLLERTASSDTLELLLRDARITRNRNPIAAEHRHKGLVTSLLYDPLVRFHRGSAEAIPWLARDVEWDESRSLSATVRLRDTQWHDGEALTGTDVAFTYEFLQDTSLGEFDTPVPTPWHRGQSALIEDVEVSDDELRIEFGDTSKEVARRSLGTPILPEHIWRERSEPAEVAGFDLVGQTTEALVWSNEEAVGSGVLQFESADPNESLTLASFEDHFLETGDTDGIPDPVVDGLAFERVQFTVTPSHDASVQLLEENEADASADGLQASVVPRIGRSNEISLTIRRSNAFYHVGYNCRRSPMSDPHFRRTVAQMLDREATVSASFGGYADPAEIPLRWPWIPSDLEWDGEASLPFLGTDGELDVAAAQSAFQDAGYQYDGDRLIVRGDT